MNALGLQEIPKQAAVIRPGFDVLRVRDDFPILRQQVHGKPLLYLDNAATSQKPHTVIDAVSNYYETYNANVHRGVHRLSELATEAYEAARVRIQRFIGAHCLREVIFTRGATEAINLVAHSYARNRLQAGDEVLVTWMEHHSNIVPWQLVCQEKGARLQVVPITDEGEIRLEDIERLLSPRTKLVALTHVSNALGTINPVKDVIGMAHARGIPVLVDGAQAVPHLRVDVQELDCDFYVFSGHKVYGPTGIGVLYGKPKHLELMPPYQGGGDMISSVRFEKTTYNELPYKFEAGTPHIAGAIGLAAALDYLDKTGLDAVAEHERRLVRYATQLLSEIRGVRLIGTAAHKAAVVSFVVDDPPLSSLDVGMRLDLEGIAARTGHHCCMPLMERFGVPGTTRASFAMYNTEEEVETLARTLGNIVAERRARTQVAVSTPLPLEGKKPIAFPGPAAPSPQAAGDELVELFDYLEDWNDKYRQIIEFGEKLLPLPDEYRTEPNRVHGCQSTVFFHMRKKTGSRNTLEFLADSDADIVRGLIALLQRVYSGQPADQAAAFDVDGFFRRLGLDQNLSMGRRNGLGAMVKRIRSFAAEMVQQ